MSTIYDASHEGRCFGCGFLAKSSPAILGLGYFEMEWSERDSGKCDMHLIPFQGQFPTIATCFRGVISFGNEIPNLAKLSDADRAQALAKEFREDRRCGTWYPYTPGHGPHKHLEEVRLLALNDRRERFERMMEGDRREWETRLERERRRFEIVLGAFLAVFALAGVTATVFSIFFG